MSDKKQGNMKQKTIYAFIYFCGFMENAVTKNGMHETLPNLAV
jgi:hypothetical protein